MTTVVSRARGSHRQSVTKLRLQPWTRTFSVYSRLQQSPSRPVDPRITDLGREIKDEYAEIRAKYDKPKHPIVLAHGLLGFDELRLAGQYAPGIQYWRGIREALEARDIRVITASVSPSGSIEARAAMLSERIRSALALAPDQPSQQHQPQSVNIIAHSMGGLDARYMISRLQPSGIAVKSLATIATPHRGSAFADYVMGEIGEANLPRIYGLMERLGFETGAFAQLTRKYVCEEFNPKTQDLEGTRYFSYGASLEPTRWSVFKPSHDVIKKMEEGAPNDGLVSVESSKWGTYKGTLLGVSHLDLINWTSRVKWMLYSMVGTRPNFNAVALYLDICDMLAKEGF
ncbi:triacylglycerol lipase [Phyllosticta paracitricarpa]|uniref:GPI inositol-deacylase n=1 Tax=Phyllosticta paracitricarpa TaxID=2016321 RepID=A0ABR1NAC8_9PEZI